MEAARRAACRANWRISSACSPCCEEKRIWSSSMTYLRAQARARMCVAVPASALPSDARAARCGARCGARLWGEVSGRAAHACASMPVE